MQSLASFFEDNKPLAYAAVVAAAVVFIFVAFALYRLLSGRRPRAAANGRNRQPRLGIVDAYDLDRQRQLVLVRRDNVEHLIMIGGPTDVVVESSIVRNQVAGSPRDKDAGPLIGSVTMPAAVAPPPAQAALAPAQPVAALAPAVVRAEPSLSARSEPAAPRPDQQRVEGAPGRTEPALGIPMPPPAAERAMPERPLRPIAVPDPTPVPAGAAGTDPAPQPMRPAPPRPAGLPPRPPLPQAPTAPPAGSAPVAGVPERPTSPRAPLPPRPPTARSPLPPRPSLASTLPPRPPRPAPQARPDGPVRQDPPRQEPPRPEPTNPEQVRPEPPRPETSRPEVARYEPALETATVPVIDARPARDPEPAVAIPNASPAPVPMAPRNIESLESLEEEMAKLLGRPAPRRDG